MRIIEITEEKGSELAQVCEEALRANGRLMSCLEQIMQNGNSMGERGGMGERSMPMYPGMMPTGGNPDMGMRGGYGDRMGMREPYYGDRYDNYGDRGNMGNRGYMGNRGNRY